MELVKQALPTPSNLWKENLSLGDVIDVYVSFGGRVFRVVFQGGLKSYFFEFWWFCRWWLKVLVLAFGVSSSRSQGFGAFTAARTEAWPG